MYVVAGIKKQNFHRKLNKQLAEKDQYGQLDKIVYKIRRDHPQMSAKKMYKLIGPQNIGRDKFLSYCKAGGWLIHRRKNYKRTTYSGERFSNKIAGKKFTAVNQVWVSDITYIEVNERFYYLTIIMDLYSRKIIGHQISKTLKTKSTTLPAIDKALRLRRKQDLKGLIFHSDGGGQYYEKTFVKLLRDKNIESSMSYSVYENAHAESVNGIIKNEYLRHYHISSFNTLSKLIHQVIKRYNNERPHGSLKLMTPQYVETNQIKLELHVNSFQKTVINI